LRSKKLAKYRRNFSADSRATEVSETETERGAQTRRKAE
jgi:hypothetical protein